MRLFQRAKHAFAYMRRHGLRSSARYAIERIHESYNEWWFGVKTMGKLTPEELGIDSPFSVNYYPTDYRSIYRAFRNLRICPQQDVFLDYGCGMGRVLVVASSFPFRRVIGIELSQELACRAKDNLRRAARQLKCHDTEVETIDAASYQVPRDVTVIFFYNPFHGPVLLSALGAIRESLERAPRKLTIVFKNTDHLEPVMNLHPWLVKQQEFPACDGNHKLMILSARV